MQPSCLPAVLAGALNDYLLEISWLSVNDTQGELGALIYDNTISAVHSCAGRVISLLTEIQSQCDHKELVLSEQDRKLVQKAQDAIYLFYRKSDTEDGIIHRIIR